jgi:hypothetical protein
LALSCPLTIKTKQTMLRAFLFLCSLFLSAPLLAQAYKDSIRSQFLRYTGLLMQKEFARSTEYMNPAFFKIVPKEQLITVMEKTYNNPDMDFTIEAPDITSVGDSRLINGAHFAAVQYTNYLTLHYRTPDGKPMDTTRLKGALQAQFGEGNVSYIPATDSYRVFARKKVVANSADRKKWTFVVVEERQKPILERFIPKELLR